MSAHIKRPKIKKTKILEIGSHHFVVYAEPLLEGLTDFDDRLLWLGLAQPHWDLIPLEMFSLKTEILLVMTMELILVTLLRTLTTAPLTRTLSPSNDSPIKQSIWGKELCQHCAILCLQEIMVRLFADWSPSSFAKPRWIWDASFAQTAKQKKGEKKKFKNNSCPRQQSVV